MTKKIKEKIQRRYLIEVNENQAYLIRDALELYGRAGIHQFEHILERWRHSWSTEFIPFRHLLGDLLRAIAKSVKDTADVPQDNYSVFDLMQVIRHRLAWDDNPKGDRCSVLYDEPTTLGTEPLAKITEIK